MYDLHLGTTAPTTLSNLITDSFRDVIVFDDNDEWEEWGEPSTDPTQPVHLSIRHEDAVYLAGVLRYVRNVAGTDLLVPMTREYQVGIIGVISPCDDWSTDIEKWYV